MHFPQAPSEGEARGAKRQKRGALTTMEEEGTEQELPRMVIVAPSDYPLVRDPQCGIRLAGGG